MRGEDSRGSSEDASPIAGKLFRTRVDGCYGYVKESTPITVPPAIETTVDGSPLSREPRYQTVRTLPPALEGVFVEVTI